MAATAPQANAAGDLFWQWLRPVTPFGNTAGRVVGKIFSAAKPNAANDLNKRPEKRNYSPAASIDIGIAHIINHALQYQKLIPAGTGIKLERPRQLVNDIWIKEIAGQTKACSLTRHQIDSLKLAPSTVQAHGLNTPRMSKTLRHSTPIDMAHAFAFHWRCCINRSLPSGSLER
jgi:hypothetical protein